MPSPDDNPQTPSALRVLTWQAGAIGADASPEALRGTLNDPQALIWLDLTGPLGPYADLLTNVFGLTALTQETMDRTAERAKLSDHPHYFHMVVHGLSFDQEAGE